MLHNTQLVIKARHIAKEGDELVLSNKSGNELDSALRNISFASPILMQSKWGSGFWVQESDTLETIGSFKFYDFCQNGWDVEEIKEYCRFRAGGILIELIALQDEPKKHFIYYNGSCIGSLEHEEKWRLVKDIYLYDQANRPVAHMNRPLFQFSHFVKITLDKYDQLVLKLPMNSDSVQLRRLGLLLLLPLFIFIRMLSRSLFNKVNRNTDYVIPKKWPVFEKGDEILLFTLALMVRGRYYPAPNSDIGAGA